MAFQRNRYGMEQDSIEISEKDLADKVSRGAFFRVSLPMLVTSHKY